MNQKSLIMGNNKIQNETQNEIQQSLLNKVYNPQEPQEEVKPKIIHNIKSVNETILDAREKPDPKELYKNLFYENEVCCLFSTTNAGKSILAVQIGNEIAKNNPDKRVILFDYELSDKVFQLRFDNNQANRYVFAENFLRAEKNYEKNNFDNILSDIENDSLALRCNVIMIDNLTTIENELENSTIAKNLILRLQALTFKNDWSILIIAHTPKISPNAPLTENSLAGSKNIMNLIDTAFALGKSAKGEDVRYIKQLKARSSKITYGADNVIECEITKEGGFLHFKEIGTSPEKEHLKEYLTDEEKQQRDSDILSLKKEGYSERKIANKLNCSKTLVNKILQKNGIKKKQEELKFD